MRLDGLKQVNRRWLARGIGFAVDFCLSRAEVCRPCPGVAASVQQKHPLTQLRTVWTGVFHSVVPIMADCLMYVKH
jgi:hypothetical protein